MKAEQYRKLKPYEHHLDGALNRAFVRMGNREADPVFDIYAEVFGEVIRKGNRICNSCRLKAFRRLADEYFKYKASPYGKKIDREEENGKED